jgi:murein DD-endopeptidase MepM/ murein hydrolase activator NlpD
MRNKNFLVARFLVFAFFILAPLANYIVLSGDLIWPIGCIPGKTCSDSIEYPDFDNDAKDFNCDPVRLTGHQGTDINITWQQMDAGIPVLAAADGEVLWVFDGKYDRCPNPNEPDCQHPGYEVCTPIGNYCGTGSCCCFWCFWGGNVVVIRHYGIPGVF